ncbi:hypothetical protein OsJ_34306 [Oryza sativa Japonica Group]|uniref:Uncharacterized protein n=2 Tax=Oryza sativa subsp. japonica TaxID=39947 RepID=A0A8J8Y8A7_ORYSJ|nr:hypothetical protein LOC_Os11g36130 [Oryza sativa Japonica Group]EAZ18780.1 hypothetical protein OsJ_34306 [Oryza sativa Japonica Group]
MGLSKKTVSASITLLFSPKKPEESKIPIPKEVIDHFIKHCSFECQSKNLKIAFLYPVVVNFDRQLSKEAEIENYHLDALIKLNSCDHIILPYLAQ